MEELQFLYTHRFEKKTCTQEKPIRKTAPSKVKRFENDTTYVYSVNTDRLKGRFPTERTKLWLLHFHVISPNATKYIAKLNNCSIPVDF